MKIIRTTAKESEDIDLTVNNERFFSIFKEQIASQKIKWGKQKDIINNKTNVEIRIFGFLDIGKVIGTPVHTYLLKTRTKQKKRLKQIEKFQKQKMFKKARKLQQFYDKVKVSKPNIDIVCPELDDRFVKIDLDNNTSFDGWITLASLRKVEKGVKHLKIVMPFKRTKHLNKMLNSGVMKKGIRISNKAITFNFTMNKPEPRTEGKTLGIDIGIKDLCKTSENTQFKTDNHGHTLESIQKKITRKVKGSKAFRKAQKHRTNYIKWYLNQIDLEGVKTIRMEDLKNLRKGSKTNRYMSHWTYREIKDKVRDLTTRSGVQLVKVNPTYTSQRCSKCGWTCKANRKGKCFVCKACGYRCDADLNAAINISLDLPPISKAERLLHKNIKGFYWYVVGQEPIVPVVAKLNE